MPTQKEKAQELLEAFEIFDNWEDRYRFLIDMGKSLPPFPTELKTEANIVHGCQSQVWMIPVAGGNSTLDFLADSDSTLVKGLIALLHEIYAGQSAADILSFDINGFLAGLGLDQHLSMGRRNGLAGMVTKLKTLAAQTEAANR